MIKSLVAIASFIFVATANAGSVVDLPQPVPFNSQIEFVKIEPLKLDNETGIYTVIATHKAAGHLSSTNGVEVSTRMDIHITIEVTQAEQVSWLNSNTALTDLTIDEYDSTPVAPALKTAMLTEIAMSKAIPVLSATLNQM